MSNGAVTRPPLGMIAAKEAGNVVSQGGRLGIESQGAVETEFAGHYDSTMGTLTLTIPGYDKLKINGFLTTNQLPKQTTTVVAEKGRDGVDGTIGLDGRTGDTGCRGPVGPRGITGARGPRGFQGEKGATGMTGERGATGADGRVLVFVQQEDPGPVGAFAFWILPT